MYQEKKGNRGLLGWLSGAAVGAAAMYLSDPDRGRRRRALATDKVRSMAHKAGDAINVASRDLGNRMQGVRAQASHLFSRHGDEGDDEMTMARVRRAIGRSVSHPRAIKANTQQGRVILHGPVLVHEKQQLIDNVASVAGVSAVEDLLEVHEHAGSIPGLQGEGRYRSSRPLLMRESWPPGLRAVATVGGSALGLYALRHRSPAGIAAAAVGLGLLARGVLRSPSSWRAGTQEAYLNNSIYIQASPETVYDIWSRYEHFPRFMSHVKEVQDLGEGRSHWIVSGPGGVQIEWNAVITEARRPLLLAWRTEPDASVEHQGKVQFEPEGDGTRVHVHMSYRPPAGVVGKAAASLFNGNPKRQMDDDLMRMKAFVETGQAPRDAAEPGRPTGTPLH